MANWQGGHLYFCDCMSRRGVGIVLCNWRQKSDGRTGSAFKRWEPLLRNVWSSLKEENGGGGCFDSENEAGDSESETDLFSGRRSAGVRTYITNIQRLINHFINVCVHFWSRRLKKRRKHSCGVHQTSSALKPTNNRCFINSTFNTTSCTICSVDRRNTWSLFWNKYSRRLIKPPLNDKNNWNLQIHLLSRSVAVKGRGQEIQFIHSLTLIDL